MRVNSLVQGSLTSFISRLCRHVLSFHLREIEMVHELDSLRGDLATAGANLASMTSEKQRHEAEVEQLRSAKNQLIAQSSESTSKWEL